MLSFRSRISNVKTCLWPCRCVIKAFVYSNWISYRVTIILKIFLSTANSSHSLGILAPVFSDIFNFACFHLACLPLSLFLPRFWTACKVLKVSSHPYCHFPRRWRGNRLSFCQTSQFNRSCQFTRVWLRSEPGKVSVGTRSNYWWKYCEIDLRPRVFANIIFAVFMLKESPVSQAISDHWGPRTVNNIGRL